MCYEKSASSAPLTAHSDLATRSGDTGPESQGQSLWDTALFFAKELCDVVSPMPPTPPATALVSVSPTVAHCLTPPPKRNRRCVKTSNDSQQRRSLISRLDLDLILRLTLWHDLVSDCAPTTFYRSRLFFCSRCEFCVLCFTADTAGDLSRRSSLRELERHRLLAFELPEPRK